MLTVVFYSKTGKFEIIVYFASQFDECI